MRYDRADHGLNPADEKNVLPYKEYFEALIMFSNHCSRKQRFSRSVMAQRRKGKAVCSLFFGSCVKPNGFLLVEALLALMIAVLCGFLLMTSLAAYGNALKKGVPAKIEERIPGRTPYV